MTLLSDLGSTSSKEDSSELSLEVMRDRKEWSAVASTTVRRWMLSGPVWKREIKFKKDGGTGTISILKLTELIRTI